MNQSFKNVLIFLTGTAVGSVSTFFAVKKIFELKADLEVESVRDAYNNRLAEIEEFRSSMDGELEGPETIDEKVHLDEHKSSIARQLNNKPPLTDYTKYFVGSKSNEELDLKEVTRDPHDEIDEDTDPAELEGPEDDEPYTDEEDKDETLNYEDHELNGKHKKAKEDGKPPYLIDKGDYDLTCDNYDKISLLYYLPDDIVVNEDNEIEGNVRTLIGNLIAETGFDQDEEEVMYVRNDILSSDFEIQKIFSEYTGE
ncbi:hypothetical protein [Butyrivibrio sp. INlla21]|uniref:hypothetical protein n=1 Tax=Butyrivibrio sp. INlla21 TaxID=1520811 RepID=UPI0008E0C5C6|nr:hypothetical protein [Butyrivibrio sp. INlla21]SFU32955.1 hypothetical protein SAMN02910342_00100 [Butyrivibrio sp. INlla21]